MAIFTVNISAIHILIHFPAPVFALCLILVTYSRCMCFLFHPISAFLPITVTYSARLNVVPPNIRIPSHACDIFYIFFFVPPIFEFRPIPVTLSLYFHFLCQILHIQFYLCNILILNIFLHCAIFRF
jgi:hypothetical protein